MAIRPTQKFTIKNKTFTITNWSPTTVYRNMPIVGQYFATPISIVVGSLGSEEALADAIPTAVQYVFNHMAENDIMTLINICLQDVYYENQAISDIDEVFMDNPAGIVVLITKVLEVNYRPFFESGLQDLMKIITPIAESRSQLFPDQ